MIEVKLDEVKMWLIVVIQPPHRRPRYYNCFPLQTRALLSVESVEKELSKKTWNGNLEWKPWMGTLNGNLVKNFLNQWGRPERKTGRLLKHFSPVGKLISLERSCHWWKTSQPSCGKLRKKTRQGNQLMKNLPTDDGNWGEKAKDHKV